MNNDVNLLSLVSQLSNRENRKEASRQLALQLNAQDLIIFIKDPEIDIMLPGPGFPQTLANGKAWKKFIDQCLIEGELTENFVPFPNNDHSCSIKGIKVEESVVVLIGGAPKKDDINKLISIAPIIIELLKQEVKVLYNQSKAVTAERETNKAERIAKALDKIRQKLNLSYLELSKKNKELIKINNDLDNFIYTASHDLKAPVSNIEGLIFSLEEILQNFNDAEAHSIINLIHKSIARFRDTITDLTEISKVQNLKEDEEELYFEEIIEEVKSTLASQIASSNLSIVLDINVPSVKFSKKNLRSVFYNFISNATKYYSQSRSPLLSIRTATDADYVLITFEDNGLGIDEASMNKLFTMFKRFHDHTDGTGIGLYIVKRIIENQGGKIEVESEVGKGTVFKVFLKTYDI